MILSSMERGIRRLERLAKRRKKAIAPFEQGELSSDRLLSLIC